MSETGEAPHGSSPGAVAAPGRLLSELEHLLRDPWCPVCASVAEAERSFFSWFEIENFSAVEMQMRLRAGIGMCPAHLRRLIEQVGGGHIMTTVIREALAGARPSLRDDSQIGPCPACDALAPAAARATQLLIDGLLDPANAHLYREHRGMCLPHVLHAVQTADRPALELLARQLLARLGDGHDPSALELLAGLDQDATRRASWRQRLPEAPAAPSTVDGLHGRLGIDACPVCLAAGLMDRRYLDWFIERSKQDDPSLATDPGELCAAHLHDLALVDRVAAKLPLERKRTARIGELRRFLDYVAKSPPMPRRGRRNTTDGLARRRAELIREHHCPACNARRGSERSQLELLSAALALAPVRDSYERSHGVCLAHAKQLTAEPVARLVKRHLDARLSVLTWEVNETARKYGWAYRHEQPGPERNAWARAAAQLDGRVFEGGPAPPERGEPSRQRVLGAGCDPDG